MQTKDKAKVFRFFEKVENISRVFSEEAKDDDFSPSQKVAIKEVVRSLDYLNTLR